MPLKLCYQKAPNLPLYHFKVPYSMLNSAYFDTSSLASTWWWVIHAVWMRSPSVSTAEIPGEHMSRWKHLCYQPACIYSITYLSCDSTEPKPLFWSCWQQCVLSEEDTTSFFLLLTTLKRWNKTLVKKTNFNFPLCSSLTFIQSTLCCKLPFLMTYLVRDIIHPSHVEWAHVLASHKVMHLVLRNIQ